MFYHKSQSLWTTLPLTLTRGTQEWTESNSDLPVQQADALLFELRRTVSVLRRTLSKQRRTLSEQSCTLSEQRRTVSKQRRTLFKQRRTPIRPTYNF